MSWEYARLKYERRARFWSALCYLAIGAIVTWLILG